MVSTIFNRFSVILFSNPNHPCISHLIIIGVSGV